MRAPTSLGSLSLGSLRLLAATLLAGSFVPPLSAAVAVVDFETVTTDNFDNPQTHQEFDWEFSADGWFVGPHDVAFCPDCTSNGTSVLSAAGDRDGEPAHVTMSRSDNATFSILEIDAATQNSTELNQLEIVGTFSGGGTITQILEIDGTFDTYSLAGFVELESARFSSVNRNTFNFGGFSIDNLQLVPEPSSLALAGIALALSATARLRGRSFRSPVS